MLTLVVAGKARVFGDVPWMQRPDGAYVSPRGVAYTTRTFAEALAASDGIEAHDGTPG